MQIQISFAAAYDFNQYTQYVPRPDPPRKNDQNRGEVAGQNKYPNLNFLQKRKEVMEQYYNTEQCPIQPVNRICKRK